MTDKSKIVSVQEIFNPESPESTEFRRILHNLAKSKKGGDKQAILITSATLSEGKSLTSAFLAMTSATYKNDKTLLIDLDLRRPTIHTLFGLKRETGVAEIILNGLVPKNAVKPTSIEKLDILTAGKFVPSVSELVRGPHIHRIIEEMKFYYEAIFIDSPPLIPVIDTLVFLEECDSVLLVIKAGATQKAVINRARDLLTSQNGKLVGVIMNNMKKTLPYYYNHNYYGYHYKSSDK